MQATIGALGLACCLASTAGCDLEDGEGRDTLEVSLRTGDWGCRTCGYSNSPMFGTHALDRFIGEGGPAGADLKLTEGASPQGDRSSLRVQGQEIIVETPSGAVQGAALVGWSLVFTDGVSEFLVEVTAFQEHPDWVDGAMIPTYGLSYRDPQDPDGPALNVCPGLGLDHTSVVLITEELYDNAAKTVEPDQKTWVTMACRGHALMKLKFLGYDPNDGYGSSWEQRQAALKMLTADYCGEGHSFTTIGQPLSWVDELENFPAGPYIDGIVEAKWTEDGASCLDDPRAVPRAEVESFCNPPPCDGDTDLDGARWLSVIPKP